METPNLDALITTLSESEQTMARMYLCMMPSEVIQQIETMVPQFMEHVANDDKDGLANLIMMFGADAETAQNIVAMYGVNQ